MSSSTIQIRSKGTITLPSELRKRYHLEEGDVITITDLGDGAILLTPRVSDVARLIDRTAAEVAASGTSLEELLEVLDEERGAYYREHFAPS